VSDSTDNTERQEPTVTAPESSGHETTFTQADIDRIAGERAHRAAEAATARLLEKLGVPDVNAAAALLDEYRQRKAADMTEAEKAAAALDAARKEAEALKAALEAERAARLVDRRDAAIRAALTNAEDSAAVLTLLKATLEPDVSAVIDEAGAINEKAVTRLVAEATKRWPGMFKSNAPGSPSNNDGRVPQPDVSKVLANLPKLRL